MWSHVDFNFQNKNYFVSNLENNLKNFYTRMIMRQFSEEEIVIRKPEWNNFKCHMKLPTFPSSKMITTKPEEEKVIESFKN